jgi:hypothetical protein
VIESLCVLKYSAVSLGQYQKFIELSLNESFRDMVRSKGGLEFFPSDNISLRLHSIVVVPPNASSTTKLLGCEESFICFGAWDGEYCKLGFDGTEPGIYIKGLFSLMEERRLCTKEILITSRWMFFTSTLRRTELMLLGLH